MGTARDTGGRRDRGSAAVELTILTPALILLLLFVVACGRLASARLTVNDVAHQAARTLTLTRDPAAAVPTARAAAAAAAADEHLPCRRLDVTVDTPSARSLTVAVTAVVTVHVRCTVDLADLTGLGLPSTTVLTGTATSPIDRHRGGPP